MKQFLKKLNQSYCLHCQLQNLPWQKRKLCNAKVYFLKIALILTLAMPLQVFAANVVIDSVRHRADADKTRLVFSTSGHIDHKAFTLKAPDRVVLDLNNAVLLQGFPKFNLRGSMVKKIRHAKRGHSSIVWF